MHQLKYPIDPDIPDKVWSVVTDFLRIHGNYPGSILLGYGTYLCLTYVVEKQRMSHTILGITEFQGIPIIVDPGYEYRIIAIDTISSCLDQAINALHKNQNDEI
ncbi:hypothetical protein [Chroococcidiopsis sp.]|uniref:hypothetical protein n=1 Tax=Chroococcidiopsis sp. TaxID=3088168 RepID=UPI003F2BFCF9